MLQRVGTIVALGSAALLVMAASPAAAGSAQPPADSLRQLDERVLTAGYRLAIAGSDLCASRQYQSGFAIHDLSQYGGADRAALAATALAEGPAVLALVPDGPAAAAGLQRDDVVLAADGEALPRAPADAENSFAPTERIIDALERAFSDGRAVLAVRRAGADLIVEVAAALGCASRFQVVPSARLNALADGRYVQLTSALAAAADDDELAGLIAHELAHNILRHRARLNAAGIDRGLLQHFGRNARLTRATEREADRFAVYLLVRAGYDPAALIRIWTRVAPRGGLLAGTHPRWRDRIAAVRAEIAEVERLRSAGQDIRPAWSPAPLD